MKNLTIALSVFLIGISVHANAFLDDVYHRGYDGNAFIFQEGNVEFSIFPDGQFDFIYIGPQKSQRVIINTPNLNISYNAGYNYDTYIQYDMYGAVIQVENIPIFYDYYGRVTRIGNVEIRYHDRQLVQIGGLHLFYNRGGAYSHYTGYINVYNRYYVYRPWHIHYIRPYYTHVIVYDYPYRMHYHPVRYSYKKHQKYYADRGRSNYVNGRRDFVRPGSRIHSTDGKMVRNPDFNPNRTNTMIANGARNNSAGLVTHPNGRNNTNTANTGRNDAKATNTGRNNTSSTVRNNSSATPSTQVNTTTRTTTPVKAAGSANSSIKTDKNPANTRVVNPSTRSNTTTTRQNTSVNTAPTTKATTKPTVRQNATRAATSTQKSTAPRPTATQSSNSSNRGKSSSGVGTRSRG